MYDLKNQQMRLILMLTFDLICLLVRFKTICINDTSMGGIRVQWGENGQMHLNVTFDLIYFDSHLIAVSLTGFVSSS